MKTSQMTSGRVMLGELFSLQPTEYYIIVTRRSIDLVRVRSKGRMEVLVHSEALDTPEASWEAFCRRVADFPGYFGQPVRILIHNDKVFTYLRRLVNESPAQLYERLTAIPKDNLETRQAILDRANTRLFVWQAIYRDYLQSIAKSLSTNHIKATEILSLAGFLLTAGPVLRKDRPSTYLFNLPSGDRLYVVFSGDGGILVDSLPDQDAPDLPQNTFTRIDEAYHAPLTSKHMLFVSYMAKTSNAAGEKQILGKLFRLSASTQSEIRRLSYSSTVSRTATALRVALNATRLLTAILISVAVVLAAVAGLMNLRSASLTQPIDEFQERYSAKLRLTQDMESLKAETARLRSEQGNPRQSAAIISSFCQRAFGGLFLTDLTLQYGEAAKVQVEAKGAARNEASVFALRDQLAEQMDPYPVTVNSVRPQGRGIRGPGDSLITFGLSVSISE